MKKIGNLFIVFFMSAMIMGGCNHSTQNALNSEMAEKTIYLNELKQELLKAWPENHTINLVFHGHSVPSGYFNTPNVQTLQSYPYLTLQTIKEYYPNAVVNSIVTAIGGENSEQGSVRFAEEVLVHRPDVIFIDYGLNDRRIGLERARSAWEKMIQEALKQHVKVILLTPTPDLNEDILNPDAPLGKHSQQIRELAGKYQTGLVDSYVAFKQLKQKGSDLKMYMSLHHHPNEMGHRIVRDLILEWFTEQYTF